MLLSVVFVAGLSTALCQSQAVRVGWDFGGTSPLKFGGNSIQPSMHGSSGIVVGALEKGTGLLTTSANFVTIGFGSDVRVADTLDAAIAANQSYYFTVLVTSNASLSFLTPLTYQNGVNGPRFGAWYFASARDPTNFTFVANHTYVVGSSGATPAVSFRQWPYFMALQDARSGDQFIFRLTNFGSASATIGNNYWMFADQFISVVPSGALPEWRWVSGPGALTKANSSLGIDSLSYYLNNAVGDQWWELAAIAPSAGVFKFYWDWSGLHSWYLAKTQVDAASNNVFTTIEPRRNCSDQFVRTGTYEFIVAGGQTMKFRIFGSHFDSAKLFYGTFTVLSAASKEDFSLVGSLKSTDPVQTITTTSTTNSVNPTTTIAPTDAPTTLTTATPTSTLLSATAATPPTTAPPSATATATPPTTAPPSATAATPTTAPPSATAATPTTAPPSATAATPPTTAPPSATAATPTTAPPSATAATPTTAPPSATATATVAITMTTAVSSSFDASSSQSAATTGTSTSANLIAVSNSNNTGDDLSAANTTSSTISLTIADENTTTTMTMTTTPPPTSPTPSPTTTTPPSSPVAFSSSPTIIDRFWWLMFAAGGGFVLLVLMIVLIVCVVRRCATRKMKTVGIEHCNDAEMQSAVFDNPRLSANYSSVRASLPPASSYLDCYAKVLLPARDADTDYTGMPASLDQ